MLQQDLDTLTIFAETWQMQFNVNECSILQYPNTITKVYFHILYVREAPQDRQTALLFGNSINHHISWNPQVDYVCSKVTS